MTGAVYLGPLEIEVSRRDKNTKGQFISPQVEYEAFEVMETEEKLIFGSFCNAGFLESGYILKGEGSTDETLENLNLDLITYYQDGPEYVSEIVFNDRM